MAEPPDLSNLAKRYVELWQDYLTAAAADPDLALASLCRISHNFTTSGLSVIQAQMRPLQPLHSPASSLAWIS